MAGSLRAALSLAVLCAIGARPCPVGAAVLDGGAILRGLRDAHGQQADAPAVEGTPLPIQKIDFFENSTRADLSPSEQRILVKIASLGPCGGFFVKNEKNRLLIATARHCAGYKFKEECARGDVWVGAPGGNSGTCVRVIAEGTDDDVVVFEAEFKVNSSIVRQAADFLPLSADPPPAGSPLKVLGFPSDKFRSGRATATGNCSVNDGPDTGSLLSSGQQVDSHDNSSFHRLLWEHGTTYEAFMEEFARINQRAEIMKFNCTTYGGDSGGPVMIPGVQAAFGMPAGGYPVYQIFPATASSRFYPLYGFVARHRQQLEDAGVELFRFR